MLSRAEAAAPSAARQRAHAPATYRGAPSDLRHVGRRDGAADEPSFALVGDGPPPARGKRAEAVASNDMVRWALPAAGQRSSIVEC